jgi:RNA polymerase sigma factor (sigma-70 family)
MASGDIRGVIRHLRRTVLEHEGNGMTDGQLLERFVTQHDEAAFAALVRRHGPMVLGVCRRVLHDSHDAEDAFQATFLVLVRKAGSIRQRELVGNWLYGTAYRAALETKAANASGRARERPMREIPEREAPADNQVWQNLRPLLDQELSKLPEKYRVPVILCDLEGRKRKEVARQLGIPEGTLSSRLATARKMLAKRLGRHGLPLSAGAVAVALSRDVALAAVPAPLVDSTIKAATALVTGHAATGLISAKVAALTEGVLRGMLMSKLKVATVVLLAFTFLTTGLGGLTWSMQAGEGNRAHPTHRPAPGNVSVAERSPPGPEPGRTSYGLPRTVGPAPTWGTAIDPDGDCKIRVEKERLAIVLPDSDHALCVERGRMNAPRVLCDVEGDFIAQARVDGPGPDGAEGGVKDYRPFHGAGLLLWVDENNYVRLERARLVYEGRNLVYANFELSQDGELARTGDAGEMPLPDGAIFLRLERHDGAVLAATSPDGVRWTSFDPLDVKPAPQVRVGIVAEQNISEGPTPEFSDFKLFR